MIVVDTNIIAYFLIEGERTPQARGLWQHNPDWCLPPLWRHEFLNVLSTYVREGGMDLSGAKRVWHSAGQLFTQMENAVDMDAALELSVAKGISTYDAQFVALAGALGAPLISEDKRLRRRCGEAVMSMAKYLKG